MARPKTNIPPSDQCPPLSVDDKQSWGDSLRAMLGGIFICMWTAALGLIIAALMTGHWVILPHPKVGETLQGNDLNAEPANNPQLTAAHFLYADCPCSRRVLEHVLDRDPVDGVREKIVLIDDRPAANDSTTANATNRGFEIETVTPAELKNRYGIEAAPLLVVANGSKKIVYSGGYTARKQGPNIQDTTILTALANGNSPKNLPVFGCAVSEELQALLDPLKLKY